MSLIERVKDLPTRLWYMDKTLEQGWSRDTLAAMIKNDVHKRQVVWSATLLIDYPCPAERIGL